MSSRVKLFLLSLFFAAIAVLYPACSNEVSTITYPVGDSTASIVWDGLNRTFLIHIPPNFDENESMPLLICLHGGGGTGNEMVKLTLGGFNNLADEEDFIVVYPDGIENKWNDGRAEQFSQTDDVGYILELIKQLALSLNIDENRVYVTGISNGAHMSMCLARELSDQFAAVAPVAYAMSEKEAALPVATKPISVLIMTGTADPLVPWQGGEGPDLQGERMLGPMLSVPATVIVLAAYNQCALTPAVTWEPNKDPQDGTRVRKEIYSVGSQGTEVILYEIVGGGHTWTGGWQFAPVEIAGKTCRDIDACEVIWSFFKNHSR